MPGLGWALLGCAVTLLVVVASMPLDLGAFSKQTVNISGAE